REKTNHPQIISTNRHITQGGYDLLNVLWKQNNLSGISKVVKNDKYELYIYLPKGYTIQSALMENQKMIISIKNNVAVLSYIPSSTGAVNWKVAFAKKSR
ncbi:MAG: hypothetical protein ACXVBT_01200, partial [Flavisolibacter sp.]